MFDNYLAILIFIAVAIAIGVVPIALGRLLGPHRPDSDKLAPYECGFEAFEDSLVHSQDIPKFMAWRLREFPKMFPDGKYPPNTLLIIDRLVGEQFLVEVQTIAVL